MRYPFSEKEKNHDMSSLLSFQVEYEGKSTNVFVGQKGSPLRKKNVSMDHRSMARNRFILANLLIRFILGR